VSRAPLRLALAVHVHQPVGNFDEVFEDHLTGVYRPLLDAVLARDNLPFALHISGPLLDWLETNAGSFVDEIGRQATDGRLELLAGGRSEPILAAWPPEDRVEQLEAMRAALATRFGVDARGAWLTERVWEPDLPADMARAGIEYTLLDDRHFLATGLERERLDLPYRTESGGRPLTVLPIDERLRYLIPFRPVREIEAFLEARRADGTRLLVLGDDGEKFGGWPGTRAWVYAGGWLERFLDLLDRLRADGTLELVRTETAASLPAAGLVYPATGSYREMEEWTLPRPAALELERLEAAEGTRGPSPFVRGGHWKGFLTRYPESNRMHKTALALGRLCRERGDPAPVRDALVRAQCNDAYWHGVFGGIYLPHLRAAVWRALAEAERHLRRDERLGHEHVDRDMDGHAELCVHASRFSAVLSPARGGAIECLMRLDTGENDADVLTRYLEAYHVDPAGTAGPGAGEFPPADAAPERTAGSDARATGGLDGDATAGVDARPWAAGADGTASIHEGEGRAVPPAVDRAARALFQERVFAAGVDTSDPDRTDVSPLHDASRRPFALAAIRDVAGALEVDLVARGDGPSLSKRYRFREDGEIRVTLEWDPRELPSDARVTTELSLACPRPVEPDAGAVVLRADIVTLGRSERGFERVRQGESVTVAWPASAGTGRIVLEPPPPP